MKQNLTYQRMFVSILESRIKEKAPLMQFLIGPRQVGKTTGIESFLKRIKSPYLYKLAEADLDRSSSWLRLQWQKALGANAILIIDEIQKIENWSETIKSLWDSTQKSGKNLKCVFLGSSSLNLMKGLSEALTGRYELIRVYHWSLLESQRIAKNLTFDRFCQFGGYPKSYDFLSDTKRFKQYIRESIVLNAIEKDILLNQSVKKPALFKQLAEILANYPSKEISYTKLLGQLQEGGNVDLIKHYLNLYEGAFLFKQVYKFSGPKSRLTSPKILVLAQALIYALSSTEIAHGYEFENLVGSELIKHVDEIFYWREGDYEVDFVVQLDKRYYAIEVKSGRKKHSRSLEVFQKKFKSIPFIFIDPDEYERLCQMGSNFFKK